MRRIAVTGSEVGGFQAGLQRVVQSTGGQIDLVGRSSKFDYGGTYTDLSTGRTAQILLRLGNSPRGRFGAVGRGLAEPMLAARSLLIAVSVARKYRVLVMCGGELLTRHPNLELLTYRLLGVRTIVKLHGSDARPWYLNGARIGDPTANNDFDRVARRVRRQAALFRSVDRWATTIVASPGISQYFTRAIVDRTHLGKISPRKVTPQRDSPSQEGPRSRREPFRVLHAPTRRFAKGTDEILRTVERLQQEGLAIEIELIEHASNAAVHEAICRADAVIDQLWSDMPGGSLSYEALSLGRPAIVGSWQARWLNERYDGVSSCPPTVLIEPAELHRVLRGLATDPAHYDEQVARIRVWQAGDGSQRRIAERWLRLLDGHIDKAWMFEVDQVNEVFFGFALPATVQHFILGLISKAGIEALALQHRPRLESEIVAFARAVDTLPG